MNTKRLTKLARFAESDLEDFRRAVATGDGAEMLAGFLSDVESSVSNIREELAREGGETDE